MRGSQSSSFTGHNNLKIDLCYQKLRKPHSSIVDWKKRARRLEYASAGHSSIYQSIIAHHLLTFRSITCSCPCPSLPQGLIIQPGIPTAYTHNSNRRQANRKLKHTSHWMIDLDSARYSSCWPIIRGILRERMSWRAGIVGGLWLSCRVTLEAGSQGVSHMLHWHMVVVNTTVGI